MPTITFHPLHLNPLAAEPTTRIECALHCDGLACGLSFIPDDTSGPHWHVVIASANDPQASPWLLGIRDVS